jgi:hypothetical protein
MLELIWWKYDKYPGEEASLEELAHQDTCRKRTSFI